MAIRISIAIPRGKQNRREQRKQREKPGTSRLFSVRFVAFCSMLVIVGLLGCSGSKPESASVGKAINDAAKENERLMGEIDQLRNQIADLKRSQAVHADEKEQMRSKLDASTRKIEEAERKSKMAAERNGELVKQTEVLANENKKLAKENQDLRDTIKSLVAPVDKKKTSGARSQ